MADLGRRVGGGGGVYHPPPSKIASRDGDLSCADDKIMSYHNENVPK